MKANISDIDTKGSLSTMISYLGDAQILAEEFVKYKPDVPLGLLQALGMNSISVPLPTEDPPSLIMNVASNILENMDNQQKNNISFVEVGTESICDGSLPLSQYALKFIDHDDILSNESKHACVAALNSVWKNTGDNGLVIAADIATYGDDETTAPSAEFTGGIGAVAMHLSENGKLLDILNVRGASSGLTYDFYKPYMQDHYDLTAKTYPVVFGRYSNLANIERVGNAYENLKKRVNISLDTFSGIVMHAPYPGISKYNLAYLVLIDRKDSSDKDAEEKYSLIQKLLSQAHTHFNNREISEVDQIESKIKKMLKEVMLENGETQTLSSDFREASDKTNPGLEFIKHTGNIYNGSSPLCLMSLLENQKFSKDEYILWGGYGSGNQAIFMIAKTTNETNNIANNWNTLSQIQNRRLLKSAEYQQIKEIGYNSVAKLKSNNNIQINNFIPRNSYYLEKQDEFNIKQYKNMAN